MIYNVTNTESQREDVISLIKQKGFKRVADVGGVLGPWAREVVTHYIDLQTKEDARRNDPNTFDEHMEKATYIHCDISDASSWEQAAEDIYYNGPFDFIICTQTLEHVTCPKTALYFLSLLGSLGFVSVPSKYTELRRGVSFSDEGLERCGVSGHWRGFLPHRWIYTVREGKLWAWPKLNFLEYLCGMDEWLSKHPSSMELSFWWSESVPHNVIGDKHLDFPDPQSACAYYESELRIGL